MIQPDRTKGPAGKPVEHIWFQHVEPIYTEKGQAVWYFPTKDIGVARCYVIHPGGYSQVERSLPLRAAAQLILSGTLNHTAEEIHESLERIGASADVHADNRYVQLTVSARSSNLSEALRLFLVNSTEAVFPANEIAVYQAAGTSDLMSRMATPRYWSYRKMMEKMAGENHYLGRFTNPQDFDSLNPELLKKYIDHSLYPDDTYIIVCGDLSEAEFASLLSVWNIYANPVRSSEKRQPWRYHEQSPSYVEHAVPNANKVSL
jgi:zinc protease